MKSILYITLAAMLLPAYVQAQSNDLPDLPPLDGVINPLNPLQSGPLPNIEPIAPLQPNVGGNNTGVAAPLPALPDDDFAFFQNGGGVSTLPPLPAQPLPEPAERSSQSAPASTSQAARKQPHQRPYRKRFNYQIQQLPSAIYKKSYHAANRHLPVAQYEVDYDRATFNAVAHNNVNGVRAMLEHGGRSKHMRNVAGETLIDVALRYRAHEALRYLLAIGAPKGRMQAQDMASLTALKADQPM